MGEIYQDILAKSFGESTKTSRKTGKNKKRIHETKGSGHVPQKRPPTSLLFVLIILWVLVVLAKTEASPD